MTAGRERDPVARPGKLACPAQALERIAIASASAPASRQSAASSRGRMRARPPGRPILDRLRRDLGADEAAQRRERLDDPAASLSSRIAMQQTTSRPSASSGSSSGQRPAPSGLWAASKMPADHPRPAGRARGSKAGQGDPLRTLLGLAHVAERPGRRCLAPARDSAPGSPATRGQRRSVDRPRDLRVLACDSHFRSITRLDLGGPRPGPGSCGPGAPPASPPRSPRGSPPATRCGRADRGQHRDPRGDHVGRVEAAAETGLDHRPLDPRLGERDERGRGEELELGDRPLLAGRAVGDLGRLLGARSSAASNASSEIGSPWIRIRSRQEVMWGET